KSPALEMNISELTGLPPTGAGDTLLSDLVKAATAAPSIGNMQPWKWLGSEGRLFLFFDRSAALPVMDPDDVNSYLSLGAAIENVSITATQNGYATHL